MTEWEYRIESVPLQEKWFGKQRKEYARFLGERGPERPVFVYCAGRLRPVA